MAVADAGEFATEAEGAQAFARLTKSTRSRKPSRPGDRPPDPAPADLQRIAAHIAQENPFAAAELALAVQQKADRLQRFPLLGRIGALDDVREPIVHRNRIRGYRVRGAEVQVLQLWRVARNRPRGRAVPTTASPAATKSKGGVGR